MTFLRKNRILFSGGIALIIYFAIAIWIITSQSANGQSSTWTVLTLKEYVDMRFEAQKDAVAIALDELKEKFRNTNEWRGSQDDLITSMQQNYVPKSEYIALSDKVDRLEKKQDAYDSKKAGGNATLYIVMFIISFLAAVLAFSRNFIASIIKKNI